MSKEKNNKQNGAAKIPTRPQKTYQIEIAGTKYPYRETMGAMSAFTEETGLEVPVSTEDNLRYMYLVLKSQARRSDGVPFDLSYDEFRDGLYADEYLRLVNEMAADTQVEDDEKNV